MILLFGGTSETRDIADLLRGLGIRFEVSVATAYGARQFADIKAPLHAGRLQAFQMAELSERIGAQLLLDATHPYADQASKTILEAARLRGIRYLRYERPTHLDTSGLHMAKDHTQAACLAAKLGKRPLLTVGSNYAGLYLDQKNFEAVFLRLLPDPAALERALAAGFQASWLIAMQGPFSQALNEALLRFCRADVMVSKDSGTRGGFAEKKDACQSLGIPLVVVGRPALPYPSYVSSLAELDDWLRAYRKEKGL